MPKTSSYFTVFGGYVPEHHIEHYRFDIDPDARAPTLTGLLAVPCALIAGISVFAAQIAYLTRVL
jgi:hypothetical protein